MTELLLSPLIEESSYGLHPKRMYEGESEGFECPGGFTERQKAGRDVRYSEKNVYVCRK